MSNNPNCHDLANWLSHYLYFFSYLMEHGKVSRDFVTMSQQCDGFVTDGHITSHKVSHD